MVGISVLHIIGSLSEQLPDSWPQVYTDGLYAVDCRERAVYRVSDGTLQGDEQARLAAKIINAEENPDLDASEYYTSQLVPNQIGHRISRIIVLLEDLAKDASMAGGETIDHEETLKGRLGTGVARDDVEVSLSNDHVLVEFGSTDRDEKQTVAVGPNPEKADTLRLQAIGHFSELGIRRGKKESRVEALIEEYESEDEPQLALHETND